MKSSFALLLTVFIIALFSLMLIPMSLNHTLHSNNITHEYLHTQALLHRDFFKEVILDMEKLPCTNNLIWEHPSFEIYAQIHCIEAHALIDIFITDKTETLSVRLHERFVKKR